MDIVTQYSILYCTIDIALMVFTLVIYFAVTQDFGSEEETLRFKQLVGAFVVYLVSDIVLGLVYGNYLYLHYYSNMVVVYTNIVTVCLISFLWYRYALLRMSPELDENRFHTAISSIPIIALVILMSGSVFNGWVFELVPGGGFNQREYFTFAFLLGAIYLVAVSVMAAFMLVTTRERSKRTNYVLMFMFILPPAAALVVEAVVPKTPVIGMGIYAAIHMVFFFYQNQRIYNDSLTQLNNRRRVDEFVEGRLGTVEMVFYLFDVNRFKDINDTFGHAEGDRALCYVAEALRRACAGHQAIAGRYGGDEFVVIEIVEGEGVKADPEALLASVQRHIDDIAQRNGVRYLLSVSAGYDYTGINETNFEDVFKRVDAKMYQEKEIWRKNNPSLERTA